MVGVAATRTGVSAQRHFWRSIWIQALINYPLMQGNGYAFATKSSDQDPVDIPYFNTHPWLASGFVGLITRDQRSERSDEELRLAWMGTLGAVGDGLFWSVLKPAAIAASMLMLVFAGRSWFWVIPVVYWFFSLLLRVQAFRAGRRSEVALLEWIRGLNAQRWIGTGTQILARFAMAGSGAVGLFCLYHVSAHERFTMLYAVWGLYSLLAIGLYRMQATVPRVAGLWISAYLIGTVLH